MSEQRNHAVRDNILFQTNRVAPIIIILHFLDHRKAY